ncbi:MAG: DUF11 domain-containing protein [Betaproteobacteria bacterium]|nr:DUF11 domain-containing protein [Betaproteobacteria bacterium]
MRRTSLSLILAGLFAGGSMLAQAAEAPYYNPANSASSSGYTVGHDLYKTIGCPGQPLLGASCVAPPAPAPVVVAPKVAAPVAQSASVLYIPTGMRESSALMIERFAPAEVVAGQPFNYTIKATNLINTPLSEVTVEDQCSSNFKTLLSSPDAKRPSDTQLLWELGDLAGKESKTITVNGMVTDAAGAKNCMSGNYDQKSCMPFKVVEPKLALKMVAPVEVMRCDAIPLAYTVTNPGSGATRGAALNQALPAGISLKDGNGQTNLGDLAPGASQELRATVMASAPGVYQFNPVATASGDQKAGASATTKVTQPALKLSKQAADSIILGREVSYDITVTNTGNAVARNLVLEDVVTGGSASAISDGGKADANGRITWNLPELAAGQSRTVKVTVKPSGAGSVASNAKASAYCADAAAAAAKTAVVGVPAVLLEVIDVVDPLEVGKETTFIITATNQGTATDINVRIVADLENSMEYVSAGGATENKGAGRRVEFAPLPTLAPGAKAEWRVTAKALAADDHRLTVNMNSDLRKRPVMETESTTLYK